MDIGGPNRKASQYSDLIIDASCNMQLLIGFLSFPEHSCILRICCVRCLSGWSVDLFAGDIACRQKQKTQVPLICMEMITNALHSGYLYDHMNFISLAVCGRCSKVLCTVPHIRSSKRILPVDLQITSYQLRCDILSAWLCSIPRNKGMGRQYYSRSDDHESRLSMTTHSSSWST